MDQRFTGYFVAVTGLLAAGAHFSTRAATGGGVVMAILAAVVGVLGLFGFVVLARIVFVVERDRRQGQ